MGGRSRTAYVCGLPFEWINLGPTKMDLFRAKRGGRIMSYDIQHRFTKNRGYSLLALVTGKEVQRKHFHKKGMATTSLLWGRTG